MKDKISITPRTVEALRSRVISLPLGPSGKRLGIDQNLKRDIVATFMQSGMKIKDFASQVNVSESSIRNWSRVNLKPKEEPIRLFQKMIIDSPSHAPSAASTELIIEGTMGLRISGMKSSEIAVLWRQLC